MKFFAFPTSEEKARYAEEHYHRDERIQWARQNKIAQTSNRIAKVGLICAAIAAGGGAIASYYAVGVYKETKKQVAAAESALRADIAFIGVDLRNYNYRKNGSLMWTIIPRLGNTGSRATTGMRVRWDSIVEPTARPETWWFIDRSGKEDNKGPWIPAEYGAHVTRDVHMFQTDGETLNAVRSHKMSIAMIGDVRYGDTIETGRITQYCFSLELPEVDFTQQIEGEVAGEISPCWKHNCQDKDCGNVEAPQDTLP